MKFTLRLYSLPASVFSSALLLAPSAHAGGGVALGVEVGPEVVLTDTDEDIERVGLGAAVRAGYRWHAPLIAFTPEAKFAFQSPGTPNAFAMMGGARLNLLEGISPAVFAHAGGLVGDLEGFVWDAGAGLDFTLLPLLDIGIFGSYSRVGNATFSSNRFEYEGSDWHWVQFGAQCALHF